QPARHQVVHQVIAVGHGCEDAVDETLTLVGIDAAEAEGRGGVGGGCIAHGASIAKPVAARYAPATAANHTKNPDMPELPEVEIVRRGLEPALVGRAFARVEQHRPDLRFPLPEGFPARLAGRKVARLERRGKY